MAALAHPPLVLPAVLWAHIAAFAGWRDALLATRACTGFFDGVRDDACMREVYRAVTGDAALADPLVARGPRLPFAYQFYVPLRAWAHRQHVLVSLRKAHELEAALRDRAVDAERGRQQRRRRVPPDVGVLPRRWLRTALSSRPLTCTCMCRRLAPREGQQCL